MDLRIRKAPGIYPIIWDNKYFIVPFILSISIVSALLGIYGNERLFLHINGYHSKFADFFFLISTNLGDGIFAFILVVILLWVSFRDALTFLAITILITIAVTILKNVFFPEFYRPVAYFEYTEVVRLVTGYDPPMYCTFPSGHSATAFSVYLYLSILSKNQIVKFILFIIALLVAYSRIYLSAHFPVDVVVGAAIAVSITILCYYLGQQLKSKRLDKKIVFRPKIFVRQLPI